MELICYTKEILLTNYMPIPRSILELELPSTAVLIYALLLDRGSLSRRNHYSDVAGWIYVVYPIRELAENLHISDTAVKKHLGTLESLGLIRRTRRSRKEANRIFLSIPQESVTATQTARKLPADGKKTDLDTGRKLPPSNRKEQQDLSYLYQHGGESL